MRGTFVLGDGHAQLANHLKRPTKPAWVSSFISRKTDFKITSHLVFSTLKRPTNYYLFKNNISHTFKFVFHSKLIHSFSTTVAPPTSTKVQSCQRAAKNMRNTEFSALWGNYLEGDCYWLLPWWTLISIDLQKNWIIIMTMNQWPCVIWWWYNIIWMVSVVQFKVTLMVLRIVMCRLIMGPLPSTLNTLEKGNI